MRLATLDDRAVVVLGSADYLLAPPGDLPAEVDVVDVADWSGERFGPAPMALFADWQLFAGWAASEGAAAAPRSRVPIEALGAPVPWPRQTFAIGLNYREHADEVAMKRPAQPMVFTKFSSAMTGPVTEVPLPPGDVDWEVEMIAVMGRQARNLPENEASAALAGLMVGQDLSERRAQLAGTPAQFSLAKSHRGFAPTGPWLTTLDELGDPGTLAIGCAIDGEAVQAATTAQMMFGLGELVAYLSTVVELQPGDLIWTGTPAGVGMGREPRRYLSPGETLVSSIEGLGTLRQRLVALP